MSAHKPTVTCRKLRIVLLICGRAAMRTLLSGASVVSSTDTGLFSTVHSLIPGSSAFSSSGVCAPPRHIGKAIAVWHRVHFPLNTVGHAHIVVLDMTFTHRGRSRIEGDSRVKDQGHAHQRHANRTNAPTEYVPAADPWRLEHTGPKLFLLFGASDRPPSRWSLRWHTSLVMLATDEPVHSYAVISPRALCKVSASNTPELALSIVLKRIPPSQLCPSPRGLTLPAADAAAALQHCTGGGRCAAVPAVGASGAMVTAAGTA